MKSKQKYLKFRSYIVIVVLLLSSLACNFVMRAFQAVTPTPVFTPTALPSMTANPSLTPSQTPTVSPTPLSQGLFIPESCQGQPIATVPPAMVRVQPTSEKEPDPPVSKEEQKRIFEEITSIISSVYLYPDFNGVDWPGLVETSRTKVNAGMETSAFYEEMENLVEILGDDHSQFQSPALADQLDSELQGKNDYVGIGVLIQPVIEKKIITILAVFPDSPAEQAGLMAHDSILEVDGLPVVENGESYNWRVRGPQCSATILKVQSPGQNPRLVMIVRYRITTSIPVDSRLVNTMDGSRIGYILLPSFFDDTFPRQVRKALRDFGELDGLIIDNRVNGGGSSSVVEPILGFFAKGNLGSFVTRKRNDPFYIKAEPIFNSQNVPLVVLVGEDTVSFGEIFSGILQDIGRAQIAGQTTLGNVEILSPYTFEDGSRIWIAEQRFDPPVSHADWEKDGIIPDLEAYADWETFTFSSDPVIAAALQLLGHE